MEYINLEFVKNLQVIRSNSGQIIMPAMVIAAICIIKYFVLSFSILVIFAFCGSYVLIISLFTRLRSIVEQPNDITLCEKC